MGGDDTARALYLLLLGLLVASGVMATYRGRMGAALRHGFLWALIFAVVALLYLIFAPEPVFTPTPSKDDRRARSDAVSTVIAALALRRGRFELDTPAEEGPGAGAGAARSAAALQPLRPAPYTCCPPLISISTPVT